MNEKVILNIFKFIPFLFITSFIIIYVSYFMYYDLELKKDVLISLIFYLLLLSIISIYLIKITKRNLQKFKDKIINNEKIRLELNYLENILYELPIIIIYKDLNDNILTVNQEALAQLGFSIKDLINKPTKLIFPETYQKQYEDDLEIIKTKKGKYNLIEKIKINNKIFIVKTSKIPVFDANDNVKNIVIFMVDITKKNNLETERNNKNKLLYQQSKMASIAQIIGDIIHQWRQTLSILSTASTGIKLKKEMGLLEDKELISTMDLINNSSQDLSQTIDDFRNFLNPQKNKNEKINILQTFDQTLKILNVEFLSKNITIIKNIDDIEIVSLENELILVFINILNNSIEALAKQASKDKLIFIDCHKKNNYLIIDIKDNANGINEAIINEVFELYFSTKTLSIDSGIGLYMTSQIISNLLNGEISVKNEKFIHENKEYFGAKFTIKLQDKAL